MISLRAAEKRGMANFGWLQSRHSFSFGSYYDPNETGHGNLLVINDDVVEPGQGFGTHPHRNMEILSYVLEGTIAHKDSQGNEHRVSAGEFQLMSAGSGITHSEFNPSKVAPLSFLQIWIRPNVTGTQPGYQQKVFKKGETTQLICSPDGEDGSLVIKQNAWLTRGLLTLGEHYHQDIKRTKSAYIHVVSGNVTINSEWSLKAGDGLKLSDEAKIKLTGDGDKGNGDKSNGDKSNGENVEFLLFEV